MAKISPLAQQCAGVKEIFDSLASIESGQRCLALAPLGAALVACGCPELEDALLTYVYAMMLGPSPKQRIVSIPVMLDPKGDLWTFPTDETWSQRAATFTMPRGYTMWLEPG